MAMVEAEVMELAVEAMEPVVAVPAVVEAEVWVWVAEAGPFADRAVF